MSESRPEFDQYSDNYDELLRDPLRDRFTGAASEFFHVRKRDLIRDYFRQRGLDTHRLAYLDVGCGKGELLSLLRGDFAEVHGCDPSAGMLDAGALASTGVQVHVQDDPGRLPFPDGQFDFVTAVNAYHHVPPAARAGLTAELRRVLKPGGVAAIIEHNPWNPITRLIVSRTPVDVDAILLTRTETRTLLRTAGLTMDRQPFFLYFPERIYATIGALEGLLRWLPLGGQYAVFARAGGPLPRG